MKRAILSKLHAQLITKTDKADGQICSFHLTHMFRHVQKKSYNYR